LSFGEISYHNVKLTCKSSCWPILPPAFTYSQNYPPPTTFKKALMVQEQETVEQPVQQGDTLVPQAKHWAKQQVGQGLFVRDTQTSEPRAPIPKFCNSSSKPCPCYKPFRLYILSMFLYKLASSVFLRIGPLTLYSAYSEVLPPQSPSSP
jgi:hypothetical protein